MYEASPAFHDAVAKGNDQKALLIFPDCVFSNGDINVEKGIEFRDYFNLEEDIAIGQTPSNELIFSLFNDDRLLNDYAFGDFLATLGVLIREERYSQRGIAQVVVGDDTYICDSRSPYLKKNNTAMSTQPTQQIKSMLAYNGNLYCFGEDEDYCIVYSLSSGETVDVTVNAFMQKKAHRHWQGKGMYYADRILKIWHAGAILVYEFVPLGWFKADRPKAPDKIQIDMTCNDFMVKFDIDMPTAEVLATKTPGFAYGNSTTFAALLDAMCAYIGVERKNETFINSAAIISSEPEEFRNATMRDVLKWIAEAAGSIARFDRDGYLVMDWMRRTDTVLNATDYSSFNPYWYETKKITKLYNWASNGSYETTKGTGEEEYLIQDNPLLKGVT